MVNQNMYDLYMEDALVQMVKFCDFELGAVDIAGKARAEVDGLEDLLVAQRIHQGAEKLKP